MGAELLLLLDESLEVWVGSGVVSIDIGGSMFVEDVLEGVEPL